MQVPQPDALQKALQSVGLPRPVRVVASTLLLVGLAVAPAPAIGQDLADPFALEFQAVLPELRRLLAELDRDRTRLVELMDPASNLFGIVSRYERAATAVEIHGIYIDRILTIYLVSHHDGRLPVAPETFDALAEVLNFATEATAPGLQSLVEGDHLVEQYRIFVPRNLRDPMEAIRVRIADIRGVFARLSDLIPAPR